MKNQRFNHKLVKFGTILFVLFFIQTGFTLPTIEITIDVSPSVLNLQNQGEVVTVHTNIAYSLVASSTVFLNDVPINSWKSDDRGNYVAKFLMEDIKDLPFNINEMNTLTMIGETVGGTPFIGSEDIKVINVLPSKKK
ncbi:MAG: hypothetical protein ACERKD_18135 [Prolixibacteraceae bacterium]